MNETGYVENRNVTISYNWAQGQYDRLPAMAADLVRRRAALIAALGGVQGALAAKAATSTIPIVFAHGADPIEFGVVPRLNRPGGNITGVYFLTTALEAKRLGLLRELVPRAAVFAALVNPTNPFAEGQSKELNEAARGLGLTLQIVHVGRESDFETAFATLRQMRADALVVAADPYFNSRRAQLVVLAARHSMPAIYEWREFAEAGGLASYGTRLVDAYRQAGVYAGRVLKGEKPGDLPVMQSAKFEFVINLSTARTLGIEVPPGVSASADEVIE